MQSKQSRLAAREPFLLLVRQLARAWQAFERYDASGLRKYQLTQCQADVVFTLGNTEGMESGELSRRTLITKGTLTGILDRLEAKCLINRVKEEHDLRVIRVTLTKRGEAVFSKVFPQHIAFLKERFKKINSSSQKHAIELLREIEAVFSEPEAERAP